MIRKRNDTVKSGRGIDGSLGETYSRDHAVDPWNSNPKGNRVPDGTGAYTNNDPPLRNKPASDQSGDVGTKDILDNVERNSGTGKPGAIRYGID
jgi:hypothetical protein